MTPAMSEPPITGLLGPVQCGKNFRGGSRYRLIQTNTYKSVLVCVSVACISVRSRVLASFTLMHSICMYQLYQRRIGTLIHSPP